jgi:hypothetical protein
MVTQFAKCPLIWIILLIATEIFDKLKMIVTHLKNRGKEIVESSLPFLWNPTAIQRFHINEKNPL